MLSGYTCVPSMWDRVKCDSSTTMQVWTFAWTSPELLLYVPILTLVLYSVKWTTWLISVYVSVTVSLLTAYWWSANSTQGLWLPIPWSGMRLMVKRWSIVFLVMIVLTFSVSSISLLNKGHAACSAVRAAVLKILLLLGSLLLQSAIYLAMELQTLQLFVTKCTSCTKHQ